MCDTLYNIYIKLFLLIHILMIFNIWRERTKSYNIARKNQIKVLFGFYQKISCGSLQASFVKREHLGT